jgi:hypothetical protein
MTGSEGNAVQCGSSGLGLLPRCCVAHRQEALDRLHYAVALDAYKTVLEIRRDGFDVDEATRSYTWWLSAFLESAAVFGEMFARALDEPAA